MTPAVVSNYAALQGAAANRFLQTALVVDDQAVTDDSPARAPDDSILNVDLIDPYENPFENADDPQHPQGAEQIVPAEHGSDGTKNDVDPTELPENTQVNVKRLADQFADAGLNCAVLQPKDETEAVERIVNAALRSDIVVLDWWLNDKTGDRALEAIYRTVAENEHARRLIAVYTSQRDLPAIAAAIRDRLGLGDPVGNELELDFGGTRIVVLNKGRVTVAPGLESHQVLARDLPAELITRFQQLVLGLVPATALNALAAIRENTHRLLTRLGPELDVGYASHLMRVEHLDEGAEHLLEAVASEIRVIIEDDGSTREAASESGVRAWLDEHRPERSGSDELIDALFGINTADEKAIKALAKPLKSQINQSSDEDWSKWLVPAGEEDRAFRSDEGWAILMSLRRSYHPHPPTLQLGTVVREDLDNGRYWLCVQPVCDAVRLDGPRRFPALRLELLGETTRGERFHLVIPGLSEEAPARRFWVATKPYDLELLHVDPDGATRATFSGPGGVIRTVNGPELAWVAELKPIHAQRFAEGLSSVLGRVGLDESEWLRRRVLKGTVPDDTRDSQKAHADG